MTDINEKNAADEDTPVATEVGTLVLKLVDKGIKKFKITELKTGQIKIIGLLDKKKESS